jgi:hypothetical protein
MAWIRDHVDARPSAVRRARRTATLTTHARRASGTCCSARSAMQKARQHVDA